MRQSLYWIESGARNRVICCANPHSLVVAKSDVEFRTALVNSDILLPDGMGITLAWKILRQRNSGRITGFDYFRALSTSVETGRSLRYFFLGSSEEVLVRIESQIAAIYPYIQFVGAYSPPYKATFSQADDEEMIEAVNSAAPDVLWVGMTAPKQEKWIDRNRSRINVPICVAVGAVFDFVAGTIKRPQWASDIGAEWLVRLVQEPRRLWRRNVISAPIFLWDVMRQKYAD